MSLSSCHMLWYLHLCAESKIVVVDYVDEAVGLMVETADTGGHFVEVTLRPSVTLAAGSDVGVARVPARPRTPSLLRCQFGQLPGSLRSNLSRA